MGFVKAFLSFCLFGSIQGSSVTPVGVNEVKVLSGTSADGAAAIVSDMKWDISLVTPDPNWYVTAWVQILPGTAATARLLQFNGFKGPVPVECYATWTPTAAVTFTFGGTDHVMTGYTNTREESVWFHLLMGSTMGTSFGVITLRAASGNQFTATWTESIEFKITSTFLAPANANPFNGYYSEVMVTVGEATEVDNLINSVGHSFLCGTNSAGNTCVECHPSCNGCTNGLCDICKSLGATKSPDGAVCICNDTTGGTDILHTQCAACHPACTTCEIGDSESSCKSCAVQGATVNPHFSAYFCGCGIGYVPSFMPNPDACTPCAPAGCPYCLGSNESECMSFEQFQFVLFGLYAGMGLPIEIETADHRICYRTELPTTSCSPDPIEAVTGLITDYAADAKPTKFQCYRLLKAQWPWVTYWFNQLFPTFTGPTPVAYMNLYLIQIILELWILQFGPAEMNTWTDIKTAVNGAGENWQHYLAWYDSDPGFSTDAGTTVTPFPEKLLAWLQTTGNTANCIDLKVFNQESKVCADSTCSPTVKGYCQQINSDSTCAST